MTPDERYDGSQYFKLHQTQKNQHLELAFWQAWLGLNGERDKPFPDPLCAFNGQQVGIENYKFDFAWDYPYKVALEVEGNIWGRKEVEYDANLKKTTKVLAGGGHTRGLGYEKDCKKYNLAASQDWVVIRLAGRMITHELPDHIAQLFEVLALRRKQHKAMEVLAAILAERDQLSAGNKQAQLDYLDKFLGRVAL